MCVDVFRLLRDAIHNVCHEEVVLERPKPTPDSPAVKVWDAIDDGSYLKQVEDLTGTVIVPLQGRGTKIQQVNNLSKILQQSTLLIYL